MGINDVTAWAKKRLAEGACLSAPTAPPAPAIEPPPAPGQHGANTVAAPDWQEPALPLTTPAPKLVGWLDVSQPWRAADELYQTHHWQCAACKVAARGHADRCAEGQQLHDAYSALAAEARKRS